MIRTGEKYKLKGTNLIISALTDEVYHITGSTATFIGKIIKLDTKPSIMFRLGEEVTWFANAEWIPFECEAELNIWLDLERRLSKEQSI